MTAPEPRREFTGGIGFVARPRRLPTADPTPAERQAQLVRYIAADGALVDWLREHTARHLDAVATAVEASEPPTVEVAAAAIRSRAGAHRRGDTALW